MSTTDKLNKILQTKEEIKQAIINKGVNVDDTDTFASYPSKIDSIVLDFKDVIKELCLLDNNKLDISYLFYNNRKLTQDFLDSISDLVKEYEIYDSINCFNRKGEGLDWKDGTTFILNPSEFYYNISNFFYSCYVGGNLNIILTYPSNNLIAKNTFFDNKNLVGINFTGANCLTDVEKIFGDCVNILTINGFDMSNVTNMYYALKGCSKLKTIDLVNTSLVKNFSYCFSGCEKLEKIEGLDFSSATNISYMFMNCNSLKSIDFSTLTNKCTSLTNVIASCNSIEEVIELNITNVSITSLNYSNGYSHLKKITFQKDEGYTRTANMTIKFNSICPLMNGSDESHTNLVEMLDSLPLTTASTAVIILSDAAYSTLTEDEIAIAENKGWSIVDTTTLAAMPMTLELDDEDYTEMEMMEMQKGDDVLV